jgi:hypothetical protein
VTCNSLRDLLQPPAAAGCCSLRLALIGGEGCGIRFCKPWCVTVRPASGVRFLSCRSVRLENIDENLKKTLHTSGQPSRQRDIAQIGVVT